VLLLGLLALLSARTVFSQVVPKSPPEKESYAAAHLLLAEIKGELKKTNCHYSDSQSALARLTELPEVIPSWQQTARIEPSELLRSLQRIAETTNCPALRGAPQGEVEKLRGELERQLEQEVRSLFARLRRAQREADRKGAARNVAELQELLKYHRGPLQQHLDRLARLYRDS
jgi:hypothetical protein